MLIAQISDMHVTRGGCGDLDGADTAAGLARAVAHLRALEPKPDVVLATGDLAANGTDEEYALLDSLLRPIESPLYLIPGNHDDRESLRRAFPHHEYLPRDGPHLHYVIDRHPVRLVALDTVIPGEPAGRLGPDRLRWLDARLAEAPERPTVVLMHHPPFVSGIRHMDEMRCLDGEAMGAVIARHPQVERVLCGHIHRSIQVRWHGTVAVACPSTALQLSLDLERDDSSGWSADPPACLLHLWRPGTGMATHLSMIGAPACAKPERLRSGEGRPPGRA